MATKPKATTKKKEFPKSKLKAPKTPAAEAFPELPVPPLLPNQPDLPALADAEAQELEGVIDHYKAVELDAKAIMKKTNDEQNTRLNEVAQQVIACFSKYKRNSIVINGKLAQVIAQIKVKVKGMKAPKKKKGSSKA